MFHRIRIDPEADVWGGLDGTRLVLYAERLTAYPGAVAARAAELQQKNGRQPTHSNTPARYDSSPINLGGGDKREYVDSTAANLRTHPAFAGLGEIVQV